jgi:hypothetical protein
MPLPELRDRLTQVLMATPPVPVDYGTTPSELTLRIVYPYQPKQPPEIVPAAWLGDSTATIEQAGLEIWTHTLPITVAVHDAGVAEMERAAVEAFLYAIVAQLRRHVALTDNDVFLAVTAYEEGVIAFQGKTYRGFTFTAELTEKFEVAAEYWPQAV